jgi:hypothetical protein
LSSINDVRKAPVYRVRHGLREVTRAFTKHRYCKPMKGVISIF